MASAGDSNEQGSVPMNNLYPHWRLVFNQYDEDSEGSVPLDKLKQRIQSGSATDIPPHCVKRILRKANTNKNGKLYYEEFRRMAEEPEVHGVLYRGLQQYVHTIVPTHRRKQRFVFDAFDGGEYEEEYTCYPPPVCMIILSIVELVIFLYDLIVDGRHSTVHGTLADVLIYNPNKRYEAWRFISYIFVHVGVLHLVVNLAVQIMLGIPLEMVHRWWRVLVIYLAGALAGSLATSVTDPKVYLAGASGGVYAIMTAHLATIIMNWKEMQFAMYQLTAFLIIIVPDICNAIYKRYFFMGEGNQVGYVAHLAGALAGLLVGINILRNLDVTMWERVLWYISLFLFASLMFAAIVWNAVYPR